jgi:hypothetical protein
MTLTVQKFFLLINQMSSTKYLCISISFLKINTSESIFLVVNYPKVFDIETLNPHLRAGSFEFWTILFLLIEDQKGMLRD